MADRRGIRISRQNDMRVSLFKAMPSLAKVRKYIIIYYICTCNLVCMNRLRNILILLAFWRVIIPASAQQMENIYISDTLSNLSRAEVYYSMAVEENSVEERVQLFRMSLDLFDTAYDSGHVGSLNDSLDVIIKMSRALISLGMTDGIAPLLQEAVDAVGDRYGTQSAHYVDILRRAAAICDMAGDHVQASFLFDECENIAKEYCSGRYGGFSPEMYAAYLRARCMNEIAGDRWANAYRIARKAHDVMKNEGIGGESYYSNLMVLSDLCGSTGRSNARRRYQKEASGMYMSDLLEDLGNMSEIRRNVYWENASDYFEGIVAGGSSSEAYDALLFSKGLLLNTSIEFRNFIEQSESHAAKRALAVMDSLVVLGADARQIDSVDFSIVGILQSEGLNFVPTKGGIRWQDVQSALGPDDLAMEFYRENAKEYGVLLLKKGWKRPKRVSLGSAYKVARKKYRSFEDPFVPTDMLVRPDSLVNDDIRKSRAIWTGEIRRHFPRTEEGKIYFSPDGIFHQIGIEYLPLYTGSDYDGSTIMDNYKIFRLSSTEELVRNVELGGQTESASIYGGIRFNPSSVGDLKYAVQKVSSEDGSLVDELYEEDLKILEKRNVSRSYSGGAYIAPLPKTAREVHEVDDVLSDYGAESRLYTGLFANEEAFKTKTQGQQIIHVATHGFYVTASDALNSNEYYKARFSQNPSVLSDPLYRSGLHFAGATPAWAGYPDILGLEDGVLTAKEISLLSLSDAGLVVLSACHTGSGEIAKDGVYGLQRAFKKAGAKSIIMSIWEVDDEATFRMMSYFYNNRYIDGMSKYEAFAKAQRQLRAEFPNPYYWRAFVLLDPDI